MVELDRWRPAATEGRGVIPHNVHVLNDYLVISYYSDGVIIVDAANPDNLVEVGNYDTWSGADGGFNGAWGAYPFLPSGKVLVSDRSTGLYVLEPNYVRACYLEGVVTDAETGDPILSAVVNISSAEAISGEFTNISGEYKMGKADAGTFYVSASHPEYNTDSVEATFENGILTVADIQLEPRARHTISGVVLGTLEIGPVPGANVIIENDAFSYVTKANSNGIYSIPDIFEGSYRMYAGVWGEYEIMEVDVDASESLDVLIKPGYYDDFTFDYGWEVTTTASQGAWVREEPILETYFGFDCNPGEDLTDDFGKNAFMTGNIGGDARDNSVENGLTLISSPAMNLSLAGTAVLECQPWMCTRFPDVPSYFILATNGTDTAYLDTILGTFDFGYWRDPQLYSLENYLELTEDVKVHFLAENPGEDNMVKAAIDGVSVTVSLSTSTKEPDLAAGSFRIYPNPARDEVTLDLRGYEQVNAFRVLDNLGRQILNVDLGSATDNHTFSVDWPAGMYFVQLESDQQIIASSKLIVTD